MSRRGLIVLCLSLTCAWTAPCASALDRIELKDGRVFLGWVMSEDARTIKFEAQVGKVKTNLTFKKSDVLKLEKDPEGWKPEPADDARPAGEGEAPAGSRPAQVGDTPGQKKFTLVPLKGEFGRDITADGVREALRASAAAGVEEVVFELDSNGGYLHAAEGIVQAMEEHDAKLRYHVVIDKAISASIWVVTMCDTVFVRRGATTGAAVAYSIDIKTGAAQVDQKLLSALAAKLAAKAESKGQSADVFRAMIIPEAELYSWEEDGRVRVSSKRPSGVKDVKHLDGPRTVLTLTAGEMVELGAARWIDDTNAVGTEVEGQKWRSAGDFGASAMKRGASKVEREEKRQQQAIEEAEKLAKRLDELVPLINLAIEKANAKDPRAVQTYYYDRNTGLYTPQSQQDWRRNTRAAIAAWNDVITGLREYEKCMKQCEKLTGKRPTSRLEMETLGRLASEKIADLKANETKYKPDGM